MSKKRIIVDVIFPGLGLIAYVLVVGSLLAIAASLVRDGFACREAAEVIRRLDVIESRLRVTAAPTPAVSANALCALIVEAHEQGRQEGRNEVRVLYANPDVPVETVQPSTLTPHLPPAPTGAAAPAEKCLKDEARPCNPRMSCRFPGARFRVRAIFHENRLCHWLLNHPCRRFR